MYDNIDDWFIEVNKHISQRFLLSETRKNSIRLHFRVIMPSDSVNSQTICKQSIISNKVAKLFRLLPD